MALISPSDLNKKTAPLNERLYFFYGRDVGNMERVTKKLIARLVPKDAQTLNFHPFDAKNLDTAELADAVMAVPMFAERVCAYIPGFDASTVSAEDMEAIKTILSDIPDTTTVVICADGEKVFKSKKALNTKNKSFADFCAKAGTVCDFAYRRAGDMGKYIAAELSKSGSQISNYDAQYLANRLLSDTALVDNEIAKLSAFADGRPVTREMIDMIVAPKIESDGFALAINILRGNAKFVFGRIDELVSQRVEAIEILSTISYSIMDIYRAKLARSSGKNVDDIIKDFSYPAYKKFAVENAFGDCSRISEERIRLTLSFLCDTDLALKTKGYAKGGDILALEECCAKCMAIRS
ncbi:DNA polymerase III subunit delta [Ruminococcus sp. NK3A76]|uniref:DNA polymerase III subunit delta n=1 Tax=Ruminococcus sp. NK3A76 TaxID=877411 RepID=UPI00048BBA2C|nr:DNA polymerase III subunit delta [Ruminococcus sp. NK3A76]